MLGARQRSLPTRASTPLAPSLATVLFTAPGVKVARVTGLVLEPGPTTKYLAVDGDAVREKAVYTGHS